MEAPFQILGILAASIAALISTKLVSKTLGEMITLLSMLKRTLDSKKDTNLRRRVRRRANLDESETHEKFLQIQRLLKEGKNKEAEEVFRRVQQPQ